MRSLIYSVKPKVGITTVMSQLPVTILDFDGGVVEAPPVAEVIKITSLSVYDRATQKKGEYDTVVIDSLSTVIEKLINPLAVRIFNEQSAKLAGRVEGIADVKLGYDTPIRLLPYIGYQLYKEAFKRFLGITRLYKNVIFVARAGELHYNSDVNSYTMIKPDIEEAFWRIMAPIIDDIGIVYRENDKLFISFEGNDMIWAGSRYKDKDGKRFEIAKRKGDTVSLTKINVGKVWNIEIK